MNFKRIINIFIVLFLIVNIFLFMAYDHKTKTQYTISAEKEKILKKVLAKNNIYLYCFLPEYRPRKIIQVKVKSFSTQIIKNQIFGDNQVVLKGIEQKYTYDNKELIIYRGTKEGLLFKDIVENNDFDKESIKKYSNNIIKKLTVNSTMKLTSNEPDDNFDYFLLEYNGIFKEEIIFSNYVKLLYSKNGYVKAVVSDALQPIKFIGEPKKLCPIDEVLYHFMYKIRKKEDNELIKIKEIGIGYYIEDDDITNENILIKAEPCYQIRLGNDEVHYINAYTNRIVFYTKDLFDLNNDKK